MFGKLLSLLTTAKGAAAVGVLAAASVTTGVVATNEDLRETVGNVANQVTELAKPAESGKPAVVAARNDADKKLRDAFQDDQKALEGLRNTKVEGADHQKLEQLVSDADKKLRDRLTKALDDVAALSLGREGRESPKPSPSASPDVKASFTPDAQAKIDAIVTAAIADMKKIVGDATAAVAALPTAAPGKSGENPGNKPPEAGKPADAGKPANVPPTR